MVLGTSASPHSSLLDNLLRSKSTACVEDTHTETPTPTPPMQQSVEGSSLQGTDGGGEETQIIDIPVGSEANLHPEQPVVTLVCPGNGLDAAPGQAWSQNHLVMLLPNLTYKMVATLQTGYFKHLTLWKNFFPAIDNQCNGMFWSRKCCSLELGKNSSLFGRS